MIYDKNEPLDKEEWKYVIKEEGSYFDMFCSQDFYTVLSKIKHAIGLQTKGNNGRLYHRHGKLYYKAYRNHYDAGGNDIAIWDALVDLGYAYKNRMYHVSEDGFKWFYEQTRIIVKLDN